ncbi:MAG TPA: hypothetical protein VIK71_01970 [Flavobacteriales bacterium]
MVNKYVFVLVMLISASLGLQAQERYGKTANLGVGLGYYGYLGRSVPAFHFNYEFDVAPSFTLAPFVGLHTYRHEYHKGNPHHLHYWYRQTVIPIGGKATYYFDQILEAGKDWDFYLAGSLGFAVIRTTWSSNYPGDRTIHGGPSNLYWDAHIGAEYHINSKVGLFLDLSTGVSTFGIAIHN